MSLSISTCLELVADLTEEQVRREYHRLGYDEVIGLEEKRERLREGLEEALTKEKRKRLREGLEEALTKESMSQALSRYSKRETYDENKPRSLTRRPGKVSLPDYHLAFRERITSRLNPSTKAKTWPTTC